MHRSALFTDVGRGNADALLYVSNIQYTPDSWRVYSIIKSRQVFIKIKGTARGLTDNHGAVMACMHVCGFYK